MKTCAIFLVLIGNLLAGCASPDGEYGETGIILWGLASYAVGGIDTVKDSLMKHGYAAPGTTYADFEAAIEKVEKINSVPANLEPGPNFAADRSYLFKYEGRKAVYYGRFVQDTNYRPVFDVTFSAGQMTNLASFITKLKTPSDPVSSFLMSRLSESARQAVADFPNSRWDEKTVEPMLVKELNAIVLGPSIYDEDRFRAVTVRPAALQLLRLSLNPRPGLQISPQQMLAASNRMLLEDAYPTNLLMQRKHVEMRRYVAIKY